MVEIPIPFRTSFPGELLTVKIDIDGDGVADGVYLSEESYRRLMEWEAINRAEYADVVVIAEANNR